MGNDGRRRGVSVGSVYKTTQVRDDCSYDVIVTPSVPVLEQADRTSTKDVSRRGGVFGTQKAASDMVEAPTNKVGRTGEGHGLSIEGEKEF